MLFPDPVGNTPRTFFFSTSKLIIVVCQSKSLNGKPKSVDIFLQVFQIFLASVYQTVSCVSAHAQFSVNISMEVGKQMLQCLWFFSACNRSNNSHQTVIMFH